MNDFSMNRYYNQYAEASIKLDQIQRRINRLKATAPTLDEEGAMKALEEIKAAESEYEAFKVEVDDLWYLAYTGKPRPDQAGTQQVKSPYGGYKGHWPGPPSGGRRLP